MKVRERIIVVTSAAGVPESVTLLGELWAVCDVPTRRDDELAPMHPSPVSGWRFTARRELDGECRVFDVVVEGTAWTLVASYS